MIGKWALLALVLVVVGAAQSRPSSAREAAEKMQASTVSILADGNPHGFGIIVGEEDGFLYAVTANHVVRDDSRNARLAVRLYGLAADPVDVTLLDQMLADVDVAVIRFRLPANFKWDPAVLGDSTGMKTADHVWIVGRNGRWSIPAVPGAFHRLDETNHQVLERVGASRGSSGGPVVSENGLVGMVTHDADDLNTLAVPIEQLRNAFGPQNWNLPWTLKRLPSARASKVEQEAPPDPLEILTRRGYTASTGSLQQAVRLGRLEDIRLLLQVGVKFQESPIGNIPVSIEVWQELRRANAIPPDPCEADLTDYKVLAAHRLLRDAARQQNLEIYKALCGGRYVASIREKLKTDLAAFERSRADADLKFQALEKIYTTQKQSCVAKLKSILSPTAMKSYSVCISTGFTKQEYAAARPLCKAVDDQVAKLEADLRSAGLSGALKSQRGDCVRMKGLENYCAEEIAGAVGASYFYAIIRDKEPMAEFERRRESKVAQACSSFAPKRNEAQPPLGKEFYDDFVRVIGPD